MLEVRAARHGDAPALDALGAAPEAGVFVLEKNGAVIGALTLRAGEIFGCAVAPEWRGRGYGTFLLRRALREYAENKSLKETDVWTDVNPYTIQ